MQNFSFQWNDKFYYVYDNGEIKTNMSEKDMTVAERRFLVNFPREKKLSLKQRIIRAIF